MGVIPGGKADQVEFFQKRLAQWTAKAEELGLTSEQMTAFTLLVNGALTGLSNADEARLTAKAATVTYHSAVDAMVAEGRALVATIKAYAELTGDPNIYAIAMLPPPKVPGKQPAPEAPTAVRATLLTNGTIKVTWDASVAGTAFMIFRRTDVGAGLGSTVQVGTVGSVREFNDSTLAGCTRAAAYIVRAVRGTQMSPDSQEATINFQPGGQQAGQQSEAA